MEHVSELFLHAVGTGTSQVSLDLVRGELLRGLANHPLAEKLGETILARELHLDMG